MHSLQDVGKSHLIAAHHPEVRMRSRDASISASGGLHLIPRYTDKDSATGAGNRTPEELLTALRKVASLALSTATSMHSEISGKHLLRLFALRLGLCSWVRAQSIHALDACLPRKNCQPGPCEPHCFSLSEYPILSQQSTGMESCHCMHLYSCHAIFIPHACMQGTDLLKHGRLGKPKMHFFRLAEADTQLMWRSSNGKQRSIPLASVHQVSADLTTSQLQAFWCCSSPLPIYKAKCEKWPEDCCTTGLRVHLDHEWGQSAK